ARAQRYVTQHGLPEADAELLVDDRGDTDLFEQVVGGTQDTAASAGGAQPRFADPKRAAHMILNTVRKARNEGARNLPTPAFLALLVALDEQKISSNTAKALVQKIMDTSEEEANKLIAAEAAAQVSDSGAIEALVKDVLEKNARQVEQYRAGNDKLFGFFVG